MSKKKAPKNNQIKQYNSIKQKLNWMFDFSNFIFFCAKGVNKALKTIRTGTIKWMKNIYQRRLFGSGCDVIMTRMYRKVENWNEIGKKPGNENKSKTDEFILFLCLGALCVLHFSLICIKNLRWFFFYCEILFVYHIYGLYYSQSVVVYHGSTQGYLKKNFMCVKQQNQQSSRWWALNKAIRLIEDTTK